MEPSDTALGNRSPWLPQEQHLEARSLMFYLVPCWLLRIFVLVGLLRLCRAALKPIEINGLCLCLRQKVEFGF